MYYSEALTRLRQLRSMLQDSEISAHDVKQIRQEYNRLLYALISIPIRVGVQGSHAYYTVGRDRFAISLHELEAVSRQEHGVEVEVYADTDTEIPSDADVFDMLQAPSTQASAAIFESHGAKKDDRDGSDPVFKKGFAAKSFHTPEEPPADPQEQRPLVNEDSVNNFDFDAFEEEQLAGTADMKQQSSADAHDHTDVWESYTDSATFLDRIETLQNVYMLKKTDFLFEHRTVQVMDADGDEVFACELISAPLYLPFYDDVPELFVWGFDGKNEFCGYADPSRHCARVTLGGHKLLVYGQYVDGVFQTEVRLVKADERNGYSIHSEDQRFGSQGHLCFTDIKAGVIIHVCPLSFQNNDAGYADYMYCIEHESGAFESGVSEESETTIQTKDGRLSLMAKWDGGALYGILRR